MDCNATAPTFGVDIGGRTFYIDAYDMVLNLGEGQGCISGVQDRAIGPYILGDVFF